MTAIKWLILVVAATVLQNSALLETDIFGMPGIKPDFFLILAVIFGLSRGKRQGEIFGFLTGLLQDSLSSGYFGVNALSKTIAGYLAGRWRKQFFWKNLTAQIILVFVFSLVSDSICLLLNATTIPLQADSLESLTKLIFGSGIYNAIVSPIVFFAVLKFMGSSEK